MIVSFSNVEAVLRIAAGSFAKKLIQLTTRPTIVPGSDGSPSYGDGVGEGVP